MTTKYSDPFLGTKLYNDGFAPVINIAQAGTDVFAPSLANLASNTPMVRRNVIAFLIEPPKFFRYLDDREGMTASLKAFVENHSRTITGLQQGIKGDVSEVLYGGSGERIQVFTNITRDTSSPNFGGHELQGRAIARFIKTWLTWGVGDENTKVPLVVTTGRVAAADYDQTFAGATILFVEPDPTLTEVVDAYFCTNMMPTQTPEWESSKDASILGQTSEYNIEFTAITDPGLGAKLFARQLLKRLKVSGLSPSQRPLAINSIAADVLKANNGLERQLEEAARDRINHG